MKKPFPPLFPVRFPQANKNLLKPDSMTDEECSSLWVYTNGNECVSCWKVPFIARISILIHGTVWLDVISGQTQPPVWLSGEKTVFKE